jgi:Dehydrogenases with different specificities (related to short-chain alcohol dehydrogenases)
MNDSADTAASTSTTATTTNISGAAASQSSSMKDCVCVVTGASRGIGKGIAVELGRAGAIVYVTGTSSSSSSSTISARENNSMYATNEIVGGPETIEETAEEINQVGGVGIPVYCDHSQDDQVQKLFETIQEQHGRLDLLVNNVFRIPPGGTNGLFGKFWEVGVQAWDSVHTVGCRSHYVASCFAIPLMKKNVPRAQGCMARPMIAMISSFGGITYTFNVAYGVGKAAVDRLAKDMAVEIKEEDIVVTSFYPGVVLTERTQRAVDSGEWGKNVGLPLDQAETPNYTGKAIVSVATDAANMSKTGTVQVVAELAQEYGFTEEDGRQPPSIRSLRFLLPAYGMDEATREKIKVEWIPDWKLPFFVMAQGKPPDKN